MIKQNVKSLYSNICEKEDIKKYLKDHADFDAMSEWLEHNVDKNGIPFISFTVNDRASSSIKWDKTLSDVREITDFPNSEMPLKHYERDVRYSSEEENLELTLTFVSYPGYPVIEYYIRLKNTAKGKSGRIKNVLSVDSSIVSNTEEFLLHYNEGGEYWWYETGAIKQTAYKPYCKKIRKDDSFGLISRNGLPCENYCPYFNFEDRSAKKGTIAVINWQGSWRAEFEMRGTSAAFKAGVDATDFVMLEGEEFKLPAMVLLFYKNGDWQYGQNIWRRWIFDHNLLRNSGSRDFKENVYFCTPMPGPEGDIKTIGEIEAADLPKKFNCVYEFDAGWYNYTPYGSELGWAFTGDYTPCEKYGVDGFKRVSDACHKAGIKLCFWFEPERVVFGGPQAETLKNNILYVGKNKEYLSYDYCKNHDIDPESGLINYGKDASVKYVSDMVNGVIKDFSLDVYRQDFNTINGVFWNAYDEYERNELSIPRTGVTQIKACEGYVKAWSAISAANPGLVFDSCSSGGRRNDLETLRFSFAHTKTDYVLEVVSQQGQNYGALSWLPFTGTAFIDMASDYDIRSRLTLSIGVDGASGKDLKLYERALEKWQTLHKYMYKDYYQLGEYDLAFDGKIAMQFNDPEKHKGMMISYFRLGGIYNFIPKALYPDKKYKVWDEDDENYVRILTGDELMTKGVSVARDPGAPSAVVLWYKETDEISTDFDSEKYFEGKRDYVDLTARLHLIKKEKELY